jgi:polyisoprenoid-binding protein YceI
VAGALLTLPGAAGAKLAKVAGSDVSFTLVGPAGMKIVGQGSELRVVDDGQAVKVSVPLSSMKTGISIRDKHMHEKYLQTPNFPSADLTVPRSALKIPQPGANVTQDAQGTLILHGKTKPVNFRYTCTRDGAKLKVQGTMHLNMNDFGIEVPSYLGVTVKPDVDVAARFDVNDE